MYDQNLTMDMLNTIMAGDGKNNEDFKYPLRRLKEKLDDKLLEIRHMPYSQAHQEMVNSGLDVRSVLEKTKDR